MKLLLSILLVLFSAISNAQVMGRQNVDTYPRSASFTIKGLTYLPIGYNYTGFKRYPCIIFLHGAGEAGSTTADLARLYGSTGSVTGRIAGGWNADVVHPITGALDTFIVISPQMSSWSAGYNELLYIYPDVVSRYRIDTSRVYLFGTSAGGAGAWQTMGSNNSTFMKKFAAIVTASAAEAGDANGYNYLQVADNIRYMKRDSVAARTITGENDFTLDKDVQYHNRSNLDNPVVPNQLIVIQTIGHESWNRGFDPSFRPTNSYKGKTGACNNGCNNGGVPLIPNTNGSAVRGSGVTRDSLNSYEWAILHQRVYPNSPTPVAAAGTDITITLPTSTTTLNGGGSSGGTGGTITGYLWEKKLGPSSGSITSPTASSTGLTGLVAGKYTFRLSVTNNVGLTHTDDINVIVIGGTYGHPVASLTSTPTQYISTTSATITMAVAVNGSTIHKTTWQKVKVPGQAVKKLGVIGSSTSAGTGATASDSMMTQRVYNTLEDTLGIVNQLDNKSLSGLSVWAGRPTGSSGSFDAPDVARNITAMLAGSSNDVILVFYPSNDYDSSVTVQHVLEAYKLIYDAGTAAGKIMYLGTTLPREAFGGAARLFLREISDSLRLRWPDNHFDSHSPVTDYDGVTALYNEGDNIHQNNAGHRILANKIISMNPFKNWATSASVITSPNSLSTTVTGLVDGTHIFMGTVEDAHGQTANVFTTIVVSTVGNVSPVADAGIDQSITLPVNTVNVSGSGSSDADGTISSYAWTKISGPSTFTIASASNQNTAINGLVEGTYVFRLTVTDNGGATDTDDITIEVEPAPPVPTCSGVKYTAYPAGDDDGYYDNIDLQPGDTLVLEGDFSYVFIEGKHGLRTCPIVVMNSNAGPVRLFNDQMEIRNSSYITVTGTGSADYYGFYVQGSALGTLALEKNGLSITGKSSNIKVTRMNITHVAMGIMIKEDPGCDVSQNFPNHVMDSIDIYDNWVHMTWLQGMYMGNTSPDNGPDSYDPRPEVCEGDTVYPQPTRLGNIRVYNNIVDSTGRSGIQLSAASGGKSYILSNNVKHSGMGGDEAQPNGILVGSYSNVVISGNTVTNTLTHGIASEGANGVDNIVIEGNIIDSSGYLRSWDLEGQTLPFDIASRPVYDNNRIWPYSIFIKTVENLELGTTGFTIRNNTLGIKKKAGYSIGLLDPDGYFRQSGNIICNNTYTVGGAVNVNQETPTSVSYGVDCPTDIRQYFLKNKNVQHKFVQ